MAYKLKPEDVERAAGLYDKLAASFKATHIEVMQAVLLAHHRALAERGVFVVEWKPIKTAPKGGEHPYSRQIEDRSTFIVAWNGHHAGVGWGQIELGELLWWDETGEPITPKPTHWMPLPPEPKP